MEQDVNKNVTKVPTVEEQIQMNKSVAKPTVVYNEETDSVKLYNRNRSYIGRKKAQSLALKQLNYSE